MHLLIKTFRVIIAKGKFHGVIAPTTPTGCMTPPKYKLSLEKNYRKKILKQYIVGHNFVQNFIEKPVNLLNIYQEKRALGGNQF